MQHQLRLTNEETRVYDSGDHAAWASIRRRIYEQARGMLAAAPGVVEICLDDGTVIDYMRADPTDTQCHVGIALDY